MGKNVNYSLLDAGKAFIRAKCSGNGDSLLRGKNSYKLPYSNATVSTEWVSNPSINGGISTNQQLGEKLIEWYNKYGNQYKIDANFLVAQTFHESAGFKVWTYSQTGSLGLTESIPSTIYGIIIGKNTNIDKISNVIMTQSEINAIVAGIPTDIAFNSNTYKSTEILKPYRAILHQNVINNPEIMIKAQFRYMKYLAYLTGGLASSTLFAYNRGDSFAKKSYTDAINAAMAYDKPNWEDEGIKYVHTIFNRLYTSFGYTWLNMNQKPSEFNSFAANVAESTQNYG